MPGSSFQGKLAAVELLRSLSGIRTVVDVGAGHGTWRFWTLLWDLFADAQWTAVEVWEPYVERFGLLRWYDRVILADAGEAVQWPPFDLAIFGDVVEHLPAAEGRAMVLRIPWRSALVSIPLGPYPQGESEGNPHEAHRSTWTARDVCEAFPVRKWDQDGQIGVFLLGR